MTDDTARATDAPPWLDVDDLEPEPRSPSSGRSRWLTTLAVAPWLVAGAIVWTHDDATTDPQAPPPAGAAAPASPAPTTTPPSTPPAATATEAPTATLTASRAWTAVGEDEARAVAVVAARRWLTTVGPDDGGPDEGRATAEEQGEVYAEHLVVEGIDHPAPGAAVVTVRAVVLHVAGDGYDAVAVRRVAVPLRFDARGAAPAGEPWPLPVADPPDVVTLPGLVPIEEGDLLLEAAEAMQAAGYLDVHLRTLHRSDGWPLVATAEARLSEDAPRRQVTVWLRRHLGRFVVAGTRPRPDRDDEHHEHDQDDQHDGHSPVAPSGHPTEPHHEEATP